MTIQGQDGGAGASDNKPAAGDQNPAGTQPNGTDPGKTDGGDQNKPEPSKTDDGGDKGAKTPEAVPYDRFQEVNNEAKAAKAELAKIQREREKADEEAKAKAGEWEQLATERGQKLEAAEAKMKKTVVSSAITAAAAKAGFNDPSDAVAQLGSKLDSFEVADDGTVSGIEEAIKELGESKPYLINSGDGAQRLGGGSNPGGNGGEGNSGTGKSYKLSVVQNDTKFYQENRADILKAMREPGQPRIIDDVSPR